MVKISYDPDADILYVKLSEDIEYDVIEAGDAEIHVDENGKVLAVEIWNASKNGLQEIIQLLTPSLQ